VGIDVFAQEVARALELRGLSVIDSKGIVRVSTEAATVGQAAQAVQGDPIASKDAAVSVLRHPSSNGLAFTFETPILFQDKIVGRIRLSMPEEPLAAVAGESWRLMLLLLIITAATVTLATYLLVERLSKPLRLVRDSLEEIGQGRFDCRIAEQRGDEFGEVYRAFDAMAERLEEMSANGKAAQPTAESAAEATLITRRT
jgi:serine/threonine-protein kinase